MAKRNDASSGGDESVLALQPCKQTKKKKPSDHITINICKRDNEQGPAVVPCRTQGTLLNAL